MAEIRAKLPCHGTRVTVRLVPGAPADVRRPCSRCGRVWALSLDPVLGAWGRYRGEWTLVKAPTPGRLAGERARSRNRQTGAVYVLVEAEAQGFDPEGGPWVTLCERHSTVCNHETLALARSHLPTGDWCEECRDETEPAP